MLAPGAKAYKLNQPAILSSFRIGEYIVVKIKNPINETPWLAEIIMDSYSAKQYTASKTIVPVHQPKSGGYMTSAGAASASMAPAATGIYPNAIKQTWPSESPALGTMTAAPSPWGSPAIGDAISGGGNNNNANAGSMANTSTGTATYDTGPVTSDPAKTTTKDTNISGSHATSITPGQANWAAKPKQDEATKRMVNIQARVRQFDSSSDTVYAQDLNNSTVYTVSLKDTTKITDYTTEQPIGSEFLAPGKIVLIFGVASGETNNVQALRIKIQR
ncbi:MAG: hypothetical protein ACLFQV_12915 [Vulcanimicrobiota bacterium]